ncbi:hypothetical protein WICMUC_001316 [Wickerhamomyces mucosus]|uniref:RWD domain-containing protein n=1 Tax=Wickerhamomyces mucosus TaxID=1378264 RepID=A0A9P8TGQ3_9ASCO|nr:hypothetical protein WICMUC_001316 [Wickerhamomyces mucosus]
MDFKEEQTQEIEILESIYPDELEIISENQFNITLKLETESERKHSIILNIKYPETYPEVIPIINVELGEIEEVEDDEDEDSEDEDEFAGDEEGNGGTKLVRLSEQINFEKNDLQILKNKLIDEANEQIGIPSIFTLSSTLKDQSEEIFQKKLDDLQKKYDDELLEREKESQKKFIGTQVTKESFLQWRNKFRLELGINDRIKERLTKLHNGKLTGKEIFEKGLAGDFEDDELVVSTEKLSV